MSVTRDDRLIVAGVERARSRAGITQEDLIRELRRHSTDETAGLSRSHYGNIVAGQASFQRQHLALLIEVLSLDENCRAAIWTRWGQLPKVAGSDRWAAAAVRMGDRIVEPASSVDAGVPDKYVDNALVKLRQSDNRVVVARGGWRNVYSVTVAAMRHARENADLAEQHVDIVGFGRIGLRPLDQDEPSSLRPGLHPAIRRELIRMLEDGWTCQHLIHPAEVRSSEPAALVGMVAPLLAYSNYEARLLATDIPLASAGLVVIGEMAALDYYITGDHDDIDSVIVHRDPQTIEVISDHIKRLAESQVDLYKRYERIRNESKPQMTPGERRFREEILDAASIGERVDWVLLRVPNPIIPEHVYGPAVALRAKAAGGGMAIEERRHQWEELKRANGLRAKALLDQLEKWSKRTRGLTAEGPTPGCRVVLGARTLTEIAKLGAVEGADPWRKLSAIDVLATIDNLLTLQKQYPELVDIVIVKEEEIPNIAERARWEIRSLLRGGGKVLFQMDTGDGVDRDGSERRVHLSFEDDEVVKAFQELTEQLCNLPGSLRDEAALHFLDVELRELANKRA